MDSLSKFFGDNSPLSKLLPGFQPRDGQAWMAQAVADAIEALELLLVEAGTGTGKTFAYLLPSLMSGRKTIISTGTKALQDQLYHRDLPLVGKAVGRPVSTALLKGRANYLCLHRLEQTIEVAAALASDLQQVRQWHQHTQSGDRAELAEVAEDSAIWPLVTSTADNCLGQKCPEYSKCHVVRARRNAQEADLLVVNHHLLLADLAMKEEGFVEFLPGAEAVIVDEAHQLPDLAIQFFGIALGSRELERLLDEARTATLPVADDELQRRIDEMQTAVRVLRADAPRREGRYELDKVMPDIRDAVQRLQNAIVELQHGIAETAASSADLEQLLERLLKTGERLSLLSSEDAWDGLRWLDINPRSLRMHLTPLDVSANLRAMITTGQQAWVFTSATLAIGEDFSHFSSRMGLGEVSGLTFPSPYDLQSNGLVYLPQGLPQPAEAAHTEAAMEAVAPLIDISPGGLFFLFTSHRALNAAAKWFRRHRKILGARELLIQGDAPRDDLLRRFRALGDAVLLGTGSFWEGVDVRGDALMVVAIDKLPFASPADPLTMARLEFIRREGGNGFSQHQIPQAVLALKQGAGRLLRDSDDYGVIVLCDPRLSSKGYGKSFLRALEPMPTTNSLDEVRAFFQRHEREGAVA